MRILVTGANGYLGQGIVKAIIESGNKVIATDFKLDNVDTTIGDFGCYSFHETKNYSMAINYNYHDYGGILQAYASFKKIKDLGYEPEAINMD